MTPEIMATTMSTVHTCGLTGQRSHFAHSSAGAVARVTMLVPLPSRLSLFGGCLIAGS